MGYITYVGGSLIVAVAIHVLWAKAQESKRSDVLTAGKSEGGRAQSDTSHESEVQHKVLIPAFKIEDDGGKEDSSTSRSDSSPTMTVPSGRSPSDLDQLKKEKPPTSMPPPTVPVVSRPVATPDHTGKGGMPPPSFSAPRPSGPPRLKPPTSSMAPKRAGPSSLAPPPSAAASLRVPQQKVLTNTHMQPSTSTQHPSKRGSRKVILTPGHSPLDWASLTKSTSSEAPLTLRGKDATGHLGPYRMGRVTPSQLKHQNGRKGKDAWTSYQGRVYNIGAYLDFHPGGMDELMKGAGRSSDKLFAEVHPWVNWEGMLGGCLIGMLVSDDDPAALGRNPPEDAASNELDEMD